MRTTERMMYSAMRNQLQTASDLVYQTQSRAVAGAKLIRASDDPTSAGRLLSIRRELASLESMGKSAQTSEEFQKATEAALSEAQLVFHRLREIALLAADGQTNTVKDAFIDTEIGGLRAQLLAIANQRYDGMYIFSGYRVDQPAYDNAGAYQGDSGERQVEVAPNTYARVNLVGSSVFSLKNGTSFFAMIDTLRDNLAAGDKMAIYDRLSEVEQAQDVVAQQRAEVGARMQIIEQSRSFRGELSLYLQERKSQVSGEDATVLLTDLVQAQNNLQAVTAQTARWLATMQNQLRN